jgi:hypothetical protein
MIEVVAARRSLCSPSGLLLWLGVSLGHLPAFSDGAFTVYNQLDLALHHSVCLCRIFVVTVPGEPGHAPTSPILYLIDNEECELVFQQVRRQSLVYPEDFRSI